MPHKITKVKEQSNSHCSKRKHSKCGIFSFTTRSLLCNEQYVRCELSETISSTLQYGEYKIQLYLQYAMLKHWTQRHGQMEQ